ncbi:two pore domain potassium channel family protein [Candidatus Woesearchaeota archaeon]|nr:two pore domain potassium channel family protein [Candidatus Woesearchaeota archaeon]
MLILELLRKIRDLFKDHEFGVLGILVIITLLIGTIFYNHTEGWRYLDALYFSVITLTTVGYGDIYPTTDAGKIFTMVYLIVGVGIIFGFINFIAHHTKKQEIINQLVKNPQLLVKRLDKREDIKTFKEKLLESFNGNHGKFHKDK